MALTAVSVWVLSGLISPQKRGGGMSKNCQKQLVETLENSGRFRGTKWTPYQIKATRRPDSPAVSKKRQSRFPACGRAPQRAEQAFSWNCISFSRNCLKNCSLTGKLNSLWEEKFLCSGRPRNIERQMKNLCDLGQKIPSKENRKLE